MSWRVIARKDVQDAGRSKTIWLLVGALSVIAGGYAFVHSFLGGASFPAFLDGLTGITTSLVPLIGVVLGYKSISDERESGSLLLSLSHPHSRKDLVVGKFLGRATVLAAPTVVALSIAGVIGIGRYGTDGAVTYPLFVLASVVYGMAFVGFAVGLSAATTSDRWITAGALGGYLLTVNFWASFHSLILLVLHRFDLQVLVSLPEWSLFFRLAGPSESYSRLLRAAVDLDRAAMYAGDGAPIYVDWWVAVGLLLAWCVLPLAFGFRRFQHADL